MKIKRLVLVIVVISLILTNVGFLQVENTTDDFNSLNSSTEPIPKLVPNWNADIFSDEEFTSIQPYIGPNGKIYAMAYGLQQGELYSFDANGTFRWEWSSNKTDQPYKVSKLQFDSDGNIYFTEEKKDRFLYSIDTSGDVSWRKKIQNQTSVNVIGDNIYLGTPDGHLYRLDDKGEVEYDKDLTDSSLGILGLMSDHLYLFSSNESGKKLIKTTLDGQIVWKETISSNYALSDFAVKDAVYLCLKDTDESSSNHTVKVYQRDGAEGWSRQIVGNDDIFHTLFKASDGLYFSYRSFNLYQEDKAHLVALDPSTGENRWNFNFQLSSGEMLGRSFAGEDGFLYTSIWDTSYDKNIVKNIHSFDRGGSLRYKLDVEDKELKNYQVSSKERFYTATKGGGLTAFTLDRTSPGAEAGPDRTVSLDEKIELNASDSHDDTGIVNYTWKIDGGSYHGHTLNYTFQDLGEHTITLEVKDGADRTGEDTVNITVQDMTKPTSEIKVNQTVIEKGKSIHLSGSNCTDNDRIVNYTWTIDGTKYYGKTLNYTFEKDGNYTIELEVKDRSSNTDKENITITVETPSKKETAASEEQELWLLGVVILAVISLIGVYWWRKYR